MSMVNKDFTDCYASPLESGKQDSAFSHIDLVIKESK